jgi:hypothetical protein
MIVDAHDITVGMNIKFNTINGKDPSLIQGFVIATCQFDVAKIYGDVIKYHQEVLESNPNPTIPIPEDPTVLNYFIIKDVQGDTKPYAAEWVATDSLSIISTSNDILIKIYDTPNTESETILKLLRDNGYKALIQQ